MAAVPAVAVRGSCVIPVGLVSPRELRLVRDCYAPPPPGSFCGETIKASSLSDHSSLSDGARARPARPWHRPVRRLQRRQQLRTATWASIATRTAVAAAAVAVTAKESGLAGQWNSTSGTRPAVAHCSVGGRGVPDAPPVGPRRFPPRDASAAPLATRPLPPSRPTPTPTPTPQMHPPGGGRTRRRHRFPLPPLPRPPDPPRTPALDISCHVAMRQWRWPPWRPPWSSSAPPPPTRAARPNLPTPSLHHIPPPPRRTHTRGGKGPA